jgi:hypothetical protein
MASSRARSTSSSSESTLSSSTLQKKKKTVTPYSVKQRLNKLYMTNKQQREEDCFDSTRWNMGLRELVVKFVAGVSQFGFQ